MDRRLLHAHDCGRNPVVTSFARHVTLLVGANPWRMAGWLEPTRTLA